MAAHDQSAKTSFVFDCLIALLLKTNKTDFGACQKYICTAIIQNQVTTS